MSRCLITGWVLLLGALAGVRPGHCQAPNGLAASAIADSSFHWISREVAGFRVRFLADSYPAGHQDSLLARLPDALDHARRLLDAPAVGTPLDLFFVESRDEMRRLTGLSVTGLAQASAPAVFLVTNPEWRAFERHEVMHVVAARAWGPAGPNSDWLVEGLAQAADGRCAGRSNSEVAAALIQRHGAIPLDTMLVAFRRQQDLRAYLQAASLTGFLLDRVPIADLRSLWRTGSTPRARLAGRPLEAWFGDWRDQLASDWHPEPAELDRVESKGCG